MSKHNIAKNAIWIIFGKVIQSLLGLVISIITSRYLGPSNYGLISYASSIIAFVSPIAFLGLNNTLVQEFTMNPEKEGEVLGTSIVMSLISSFGCILGVFGFVSFVNAGENVTLVVCMLYGLILFFQVLDLTNYWFQSKLLSKYATIVSLVAYLGMSAYKVFLLITQKQIYWFAFSNTLDYLLVSIGLFFIYFKLGGQKLKVSFSTAKALFKKSCPYILTGLMVAIFAQTDKIMIKSMLGDAETGYYSAAVTCATLTGFVFVAIIDSFRPAIFNSLKVSEDEFNLNMTRLYSIIIYLSLAQSIGMTVFSDLLIKVLYGETYISASGALKIIVWYTTFSYVGSVRGIWILSKNQQKYLLIMNVAGALLNVVLNYLLIPVIGINGAAIASLFTQFFTNFLMGYIVKPIRRNNRLIIQSLNPKYIIAIVRGLKDR